MARYIRVLTNLLLFLDRYLVTHLMGADLNNIVRTQKLSDDHVQFLVYQILRGLKYIHSAGIIHRVPRYSHDYLDKRIVMKRTTKLFEWKTKNT